jgi:hypothetical protein
VQTLGGRLDGVEGKLDRLLAALEGQNQNGDASAITPAQSNGSAVEIRATDAARRKARELT